MKNIIFNKYFLFTARIFLGTIFIFSGIEKISDPHLFAESISNYRIFTDILANLSAVILPWLELASGLLLFFGLRTKENSSLILFLLIIFNVLILSAMARGLDIDCGCFGTARAQKAGLQKIIENLILIILGIPLLFRESNFLSLNNNDTKTNK